MWLPYKRQHFYRSDIFDTKCILAVDKMSSDEEVVQLLLLSENQFFKRNVMSRKRPKRWGVHPINRKRKTCGEYHHLFSELRKDEERFFHYTRMSFATFDYIFNRVKNRLEKKRIRLRQQIQPEERFVVTLRFMATGASFRHLAFEFRLGRKTVSDIIFSTCAALIDEFLPETMPEPTEEILREVANKYFNIWKFPNCIDAIDGRHCELKCPPHAGSSCFNYLKYHSIVLLGVADAEKKYLVIDVGAVGKQSDGGIFIATELFRRLEAKEFNLPANQVLPGTSLCVPPVLIGDEAFPLKPYLMRPFPAKKLTLEEEIFNKNLSCARKTIECAFGILRAKWRFLGTAVEIPSVQKMSLLVQTACVLHNIIRDRDGFSDYDYMAYMRGEIVEELPRACLTRLSFRKPKHEAVVTRNKLKYYFLQQTNNN